MSDESKEQMVDMLNRIHQPPTWQSSSGGMSLRDYFAAHAPPPPRGWIVDGKDQNYRLAKKMLTRAGTDIYAEIEWRWFWADCMLEARNQNAK